MDKTKLKEIINESSSHPNKDILEALYYLSDEHEKLKQDLITKTHYLDEIEGYYNKLLIEYKDRTKK
jgi:hypothetical protein